MGGKETHLQHSIACKELGSYFSAFLSTLFCLRYWGKEGCIAKGISSDLELLLFTLLFVFDGNTHCENTMR
jgi:hypothetical protein